MVAEKFNAEQQRITNEFLMQAVAEANGDRIDLCVQKGADVSNARNSDGYTPLMQAVLMGRNWLVQRVLKHNPDLFVKDTQGRTAYDFIRYVNDRDTRSAITDTMLKALPDPLRESAPTAEEAAELARRQPANDAKEKGIVAPKTASFGQKQPDKPQKGFSL